MFRLRFSALPSRLVLLSALAGFSLVGCNQGASNTASTAASVAAARDGALPLVTADVALAPAPSASQLPPAPPPRIGRVSSASDAYAFADRAAEMSRAFADAPPDYTYDDEGVRPWVWRTRDGYERVAEAVPGGERYYYYEPGSDEPFYVQDPVYGYGFDGGMLVVIYDQSGRQLPPDAARADWAGRYLLRARTLYDGAQQQPHEGVSANNWRSQRDAIAAQDRRWDAEQQSDADWRAYHDAHDTQEEAHWQAERLQRMTWAAAVDQMINDPERAQRDWRAAQSEAQSTGQAPPPPLASMGRSRPAATPSQPLLSSSTAPPTPAGHAPTSPYAAQPAGVQGGQANRAGQQAAAQASAAADHAAASREAAARAQLAQQQAATAPSQANLARQQADAAQKAQALQEQASRAARQQASAAAQADLARRQQAAAAQAQAAEKARLAQAQAAHQAQQQAAAAQAQAAEQAKIAQEQAARQAQQQAAAAHADAELARRQQAAAAQAQAQSAQKARAAQLQAQATAAHVASGGAQRQHQPEGTPAEHKPAHHPASNAAQEKPTQ